jgi:hypothetical protein
VANQITPLYNIAVSQNSPLNRRRLFKCHPYGESNSAAI